MMLMEQVTNPWIRYRVMEENPKEAFLHVVRNFSAYSHDKKKTLAEIVQAHPEVREDLTADELLNSFRELKVNLRQRNEIMSPAELEWVSEYFTGADFRLIVERVIYHGLLKASDHWDKVRQSFAWTLSQEARKELAVTALKGLTMGAKRKIELAREFGLPQNEAWSHSYFRRLLWDRHYDQATALGLQNVDEIVLQVIVDNLNSGYITDAVSIAQQFLPDRAEIHEELRQIATAFNY